MSNDDIKAYFDGSNITLAELTDDSKALINDFIESII